MDSDTAAVIAEPGILCVRHYISRMRTDLRYYLSQIRMRLPERCTG